MESYLREKMIDKILFMPESTEGIAKGAITAMGAEAGDKTTV